MAIALDIPDPFKARPAALKLDIPDPFKALSAQGTKPPAQSRSWGEVASDTARGIGTGAVNLATGLAQVPNLLTGGALDKYVVRPAQSALSEALGGPATSQGIAGAADQINEGIAAGYSPTLKQEQSDLQNTEGWLAKAGKVATSPTLLGQFAAEQVPMLATLGVGTSGTAASAGARALAGGATEATALAAGKKAAERALVGANALMGGGFAGGAAISDVLNQPQEKWDADPEYQSLIQSGVSPDEAKQQIALRAGQIAGAVAAPISAAAGAITAPLEASIFTRAMDVPALFSKAGAAKVGQGIVKEAGEEFIQEGGEQFGQNLGVQQTIDPARALDQDVLDNAAIGATVGGIIGGGITAGGIVASPAAPAKPIKGKDPAPTQVPAPSIDQPAQPAPSTNVQTPAPSAQGPAQVFPDAAPGSLADAVNATAEATSSVPPPQADALVAPSLAGALPTNPSAPVVLGTGEQVDPLTGEVTPRAVSESEKKIRELEASLNKQPPREDLVPKPKGKKKVAPLTAEAAIAQGMTREQFIVAKSDEVTSRGKKGADGAERTQAMMAALSDFDALKQGKSEQGALQLNPAPNTEEASNEEVQQTGQVGQERKGTIPQVTPLTTAKVREFAKRMEPEQARPIEALADAIDSRDAAGVLAVVGESKRARKAFAQVTGIELQPERMQEQVAEWAAAKQERENVETPPEGGAQVPDTTVETPPRVEVAAEGAPKGSAVPVPDVVPVRPDAPDEASAPSAPRAETPEQGKAEAMAAPSGAIETAPVTQGEDPITGQIKAAKRKLAETRRAISAEPDQAKRKDLVAKEASIEAQIAQLRRIAVSDIPALPAQKAEQPAAEKQNPAPSDKQQAALARIAKGSAYFGTKEKADGFIANSGLAESHEVVQTKPSRFEIREKAKPQPAPVEQEANKVSELRKPWEVSSSEWMAAEQSAINAARASDDAEITQLRARVDYNRQQLRGKMPKTDRARLEQIVADDESRMLQLSVRPLDSDAADITKARHRRIVENAMRRGESIPAEVLAEYPDLAESGLAGKVEAAVIVDTTSKPDAPGVRVNGDIERSAANRLESLYEAMSAITNRNSLEGNAKAAVRSVIEELKRPKTATSVVAVLEKAASDLMRNHGAFSKVLDEVVESLNQQAPQESTTAAKRKPASIIDNTATNPGEYLVRDGQTNLARFTLSGKGKAVGVKFFHESTQTRNHAREAIDAFIAERNGKKPSPDALPNATAPEHVRTGDGEQQTGVTVDELKQIAKGWRSYVDGGGDAEITHIFDSPKKSEVTRLADKVKVHVAGKGWMSLDDARAEIRRWEDNAVQQGKNSLSNGNSEKVVLSLFDLSGEWSRPWEQAGYQVYRFDIQDDSTYEDPETGEERKIGDVRNMSVEFFGDLFGDFDGLDIHAILAACPCTDFAVSGARHFAAKDADGRTVSSVELVKQTLAAIEYFKPAVWAVENPVGRIEELTGLPPWRLSFDPNHLGDPYTKKTLIWGRFNSDLPIAPVEPTEGSKMHRMYGGKSMATKNARSVTPEGFAYAFFQANNAIDNPMVALAGKYDRLDPAALQAALDAGIEPREIPEIVDDHYFSDMDDDAANSALRDAAAGNRVDKIDSDDSGEVASSAQQVEQPDAEKKETEKVAPSRFANNKLVTEDQYNAARERIKAKLGRLNSGVDPELLTDGMMMAVANIESGIRTFAAFTKEMVDTFGDAIRPYLLSFYEGARNYPGLNDDGMTGTDDARAYHRENNTKPQPELAEAVGVQEPAPKKRTPKKGDASDMTLTQDWGVDHIDAYSDQGERVKAQFLKEAAKYLRTVADVLQERGFTPHSDKKGRPEKPVSTTEGGMTVSGDVSLVLRHADTGANIYVTIGATSLRGTVNTTQSGAAIMARASMGKGRYATNGVNTWLSPALSAADLAKTLENMAATAAERGIGVDNATRPLDRTGAQPLAGVPAGAVPVAEEGGDVKPVATGGGRTDVAGSGRTEGAGVRSRTGVGTGEKPVSATAGRAGPGNAEADSIGGNVPSDSAVTPSGEGNNAGAGNGLLEPPAFDPTDFTITDDFGLGEGGQRTKYNRNVAAIKLLNELEQSGRWATPEEQRVLAAYVGWGGIAQAFDPDNKDWSKQYAELKELLSPEEYESAFMSTQYAHYTSREIIDGMYAAFAQFGFKGGKVLEAGGGIGNFIGLMPAEMRSAGRFTLVERERIAAGIAKHLYPKQNIQMADFTQFGRGDDGLYDAQIGNPPFARQTLTDQSGRKHLSGLRIHNYFIAKGIDLLRDGGISAVVVSNGFLDSNDNRARKYIGDRATFLGAIRLPNDAFKSNAGTEVTTDIVFFKKLPESEWGSAAAKRAARDWMDTKTIPDPKGGDPIAVNTWFSDNPQMMLGEYGRFGSMYGPDQPALKSRPGQNTGELLMEAVKRLPSGIYTSLAEENTKSLIAATVEALHRNDISEGGYYEHNGKLWQRLPDRAGERKSQEITPETQWTEKTKLGEKGFARITALADLRHTLRALIAAEMADSKGIETLRAKLNEQYDAIAKDGLINDQATMRYFGDDPDYPLLAALEIDYKRGLGAAAAKTLGVKPYKSSATKSTIFTRRVIEARKEITKAESPEDALYISIAERGRIDTGYIGELLGASPEDALDRLTDGDNPLLFKDPATGGYVLQDEYLSGNVRKKLAQAKAAGALVNAMALERVIPEDVRASEISVKIGSPWVPTEVYEDFAKLLFGDGTTAVVVRSPFSNMFMLSMRAGSDVALQTTYGTPDATGEEILYKLMNNAELRVVRRDSDGKSYTDKEATERLIEKAAVIREKFQDWVFADSDRSEVLVRAYNDANNNYVRRVFDGARLSFPGKVPLIKFRRHQRDFVSRVVQSRTALADHVVGAGKTFAAIAAAMELRRTGLAKKPMIIVPNHLVKQWAADFYRLYPGAKILTATKKDFERVNRRKFLGRIATGDWDAVIIAHSSFGFIKPTPEFETELTTREIKEIEAAINQIEAGNEDAGETKRKVKQLAAQKERLENRIKALREKPMDDLLDFGELGVDQLFVDEAHLFKNLMFTTKMRDVRNLGDGTGSQRAFDMYIKVRETFAKNGGDQGVVFLTGTPVSNSLAEMYHMMRYLMPTAMTEAGFDSFDAWANTYASIDDVLKSTTAGTYKSVKAFAGFSNTPELLKMFDQVADTVTMEEIKSAFATENPGKEFPIPPLKTGKRQPIAMDKTPLQAAYMKDIGKRALMLENRKGPPKKGEDNHLKLMGDARKAAMDIRMVDPSAIEREKGGRIDRASEEIFTRWKKYGDVRGTQLVFADLGMPLKSVKKDITEYKDLVAIIERAQSDDVQVAAALRDESAMDAIEQGEVAQAKLDEYGEDWVTAMAAAERGFSVYDDLKAALVERGIPADQVAFIHDYNTDDQKDALFAKVNAGEIRVLLGSTPKMGAGTNVQQRVVALHHLDIPWRPSDIEQREGRVLRQGNLFATKPDGDKPNPHYIDGFEVEILAYVTKDTLDKNMWEIQERKLRGINQLRTRQISRDIENSFEEMEMSASEMQAAATGNMDLLNEILLKNDIQKLERKKRSHDATRNELAASRKSADAAMKKLPGEIARATALAKAFDEYKAIAEENRQRFSMTINGKKYGENDAEEAGKVLRDIVSQVETDKDGNEKKKPIEVNIDGKVIKSRLAVGELYSRAVGDRTPYALNIDGEVINSRDAAAERVTQLVADSQNEERAEVIGKLGPFTVTIEGQTVRDEPWIEVLVETDEGYELSTSLPGTMKPSGMKELSRKVINAADSLIAQGKGMKATFEASLRRAEKTLADTEKQGDLGEWPDVEKLEGMRQRLRDLQAKIRREAEERVKAATDAVLAEQQSKTQPPDTEPGNYSRPLRPLVAGQTEDHALRMLQALLAEQETWRGDKPLVRLIARADQLPEPAKRGDGWQTAEGYYDGKQAWIVIGNIQNPARALKVLRHEAVGHYGADRIVGDDWPVIAKTIAALRGKKSTLSPKMRAMLLETESRYAGKVDDETFAKEFVAVLAENDVRASFMDKVYAAVRKFLRAIGLASEQVSQAEIRDVVSRAFRRVERGGRQATQAQNIAQSAMSEPDRADAAGRVAQVFLALAESDPDSLMRYAKSEAKDLPTVVSDILGRDVKVTRKGALRQNFEQKVPGAVAVEVPAEKWAFRTGDGKTFDVYIEAEHANVPMTGRRLFIDAAFGKSGKSMGSGIYAALFQYALNNGMVFTGDPAGLSDAALLRRTEHMLSAAIKHGTTRMMQPHPRQLDPADRNHGTSHTWLKPLQWKIGDDAANVAALLDTSTSNTMKLLRGTDANGYVYSLSDGRLLDARGEVVPKQRLVDLASQATATLETRVKAAGGLASEAVVGSTTVARAISAQSLIRQVQGRSSLLADVAERLSRASVETDPLYRAFYSLPPTAEESAQFEATARAYGGEKNYQRAKAAGRTKLTYGQWVTVRTPNFKRWFGDWEAVRAQEMLDSMEPVEVRVPDDWRGLDAAAMRAKMVEAMDVAIADMPVVEHPELGEIRIGRRGKDKAKTTSADPAKMLVVADLANVMKNAIYAKSESAGNVQGVDGYGSLLSAIKVDGINLVARISIRHQRDGHWYYNAVTLKDAKEEAQDSYEAPGTLSRPLGEPPIAGLESFVRRALTRVNPDTVSKVVDQTTGEPLVVYHGTAADFDSFDNAKTGANDRGLWGRGHYFSASVDNANSYALRQGDGARVIPAYLSIKNPLVLKTGSDFITRLPDGTNTKKLVGPNLDGARIKALALAGGHDGVIQLRPNGLVGDVVVYSPEQIKSATGNSGDFSPDDARITFSRPPVDTARAVAEDPKGFIDRLSSALKPDNLTWKEAITSKLQDGLPVAFGALTLRHLADVGAKYLPQLRGYIDVLNRMQTDRNAMQEEGNAIAEKWQKAQRKNRHGGELLADIMHDATIAGVDPAKDYEPLTIELSDRTRVPVTEKAIREEIKRLRAQALLVPGEGNIKMVNKVKAMRQTLKQEKARVRAYPLLVRRYNALPEDMKAIYAEARDIYERRADQTMEALEARIQALEASPDKKRVLLAKMRAQFEDNRVAGPYFPLQRFGEFWIAATSPEGKREFFMYESTAEQLSALRELDSMGYSEVKSGRKIESSKDISGVGGAFMADLGAVLDDVEATDNLKSEIKDQIWQLYLRTLPDLSQRKHFIHRKKVKGYSKDALRAFAANMNHGAYQIARLQHAHKLQNLMLKMKEAIEEQRGAGTEANTASALYSEMSKRHDWVMNPQDSQLVNQISSLGFAWYLGVTPGAALVNMTQTAIVAGPVLAARFGAGKATRALMDGMHESVRTGGNIERRLSGEELAAYQAMRASGAIDKTQAHNLAGIAEIDTAQYNDTWHRVMKGVSYLFHKAEVVNREATGMAAFRLARAGGMTFDQAVQYAEDVIWEAHFDYSNANRARFMQSGTAKVLLMFRQYSLSMTYFLWRNFYQSFKGASQRIKKEARTKLMGVLGMTGVFAGVLGMPLMSVMFGVANAAAAAFGDDDDEPFDAETAFRNFLADMLGADAANAIARGPVNALTGADIASRVSLDNLWLREPERELEGKALADYWLEQAAGPIFGGLFVNSMRGLQMIQEGNIERGVEAMTPKAIRDFMRTARYTAEGVQSQRGDVLIEDLSPMQLIMQAAGLSPADVNERYDANNAIKRYEDAVLDRRAALLDGLAMAIRYEDALGRDRIMQQIRAFNRGTPELAIDMATIRRSLQARARYTGRASDGIIVNPRIEQKARAQGRFAEA